MQNFTINVILAEIRNNGYNKLEIPAKCTACILAVSYLTSNSIAGNICGKPTRGDEPIMAKNMTEGNPLQLIASFALPLLVGNLFQQTYNIADAAIVGRFLGGNALAAVGASSSVQFLVLGFCIGLCCGFGVPVAQKFGAKDYRRMRTFLYNGAILTAILGSLLTLTCVLLCKNILHILSTPANIYQDAYGYLLIIFAGIPFSLLYNFLSSILRAVGDSKTPFLFLAISTILNILLDLFFIMVLHMGCRGAAAATITAQLLSGVLCLIYIQKKIPLLHLQKAECVLHAGSLGRLAAMGIPMGLQFSITAIGSMVMQSANNGLGSVYVSGFTAGMRIKQFAMCPFDALATAVSTFCSQNLGAGKPQRIKEGLRKGILVGVTYGIFVGAVMIVFGRTLSLLFIKSTATDILDASAKYLRCLGYFYWCIGILNVCRMSTQGIGYPGRAIFSGVIEMLARILVSVIFVPVYGFTAICFADQSAWLSASIYILPVCLISVKKSCKAMGNSSN